MYFAVPSWVSIDRRCFQVKTCCNTWSSARAHVKLGYIINIVWNVTPNESLWYVQNVWRDVPGHRRLFSSTSHSYYKKTLTCRLIRNFSVSKLVLTLLSWLARVFSRWIWSLVQYIHTWHLDITPHERVFRHLMSWSRRTSTPGTTSHPSLCRSVENWHFPTRHSTSLHLYFFAPRRAQWQVSWTMDCEVTPGRLKGVWVEMSYLLGRTSYHVTRVREHKRGLSGYPIFIQRSNLAT